MVVGSKFCESEGFYTTIDNRFQIQFNVIFMLSLELSHFPEKFVFTKTQERKQQRQHRNKTIQTRQH